MTRVWLCAAMLLGLAPSTGAQGFDCTKAQTRIEDLFCADAQMSDLHRLPSPQAAPVVADAEQELERVRQRVVVQGPVCSDPERPCDGFKPNELSFVIRTPFAFDRAQDKSQPFYGVILKSAPLCSLGDDERLAAQALFSRQKVFLHRHLCEDFGDKVTYTNVNAKAGFVAVYGGATEAEAQRVLAQVKASGRYPDANLRRLEVIVTYQIE